jgi:hypothetical protein
VAECKAEWALDYPDGKHQHYDDEADDLMVSQWMHTPFA